jgi:serine protease Do
MRTPKTLIAASALFLLSPLSHSIASAGQLPVPAPTSSSKSGFASLAPMLQSVMPAVVNISVRGEVPSIDDPFASQRPGDNTNNTPSDKDNNSTDNNNPGRKFESIGSGVIVDATNGYIITNAHLIRQAKTITIKLSDGRSLKAKLIGVDTPSDIAVLQIKPDRLKTLSFADSTTLQVGDYVAAIGNPFGLSQTVTSGIISGLQRSDLHIEGYENFIQTDASINPGNSGGALVNMKGELIGINTAILTPGGGNIGISFAIPSNMAKSVMTQLIKYGSVRRGLMGILVQSVTPDLATAFHLTNSQGALVTYVTPDSPAETAGFKPGDVILKVNNEAVSDAFQVHNVIGLLRAGAEINVQILRDGKPAAIRVITADPDKYQQESEARNPFLFGVELRELDEQMPSGRYIKGVQVLQIAANSPAIQGGLGLRPGDVILTANKIPVGSLNELKEAAQQDKQQLLLNVLRQGGALFVLLKAS